MSNHLKTFQDILNGKGLIPSEIIADGKLHRCAHVVYGALRRHQRPPHELGESGAQSFRALFRGSANDGGMHRRSRSGLAALENHAEGAALHRLMDSLTLYAAARFVRRGLHLYGPGQRTRPALQHGKPVAAQCEVLPQSAPVVGSGKYLLSPESYDSGLWKVARTPAQFTLEHGLLVNDAVEPFRPEQALRHGLLSTELAPAFFPA